MKTKLGLFLVGCLVAGHLNTGVAVAAGSNHGQEAESARDVSPPPIGRPGSMARYRHEKTGGPAGSVVSEFTLGLGPTVRQGHRAYQWISLNALKTNGERYRIWLLSQGYPAKTPRTARPHTARYILQEGTGAPVEFRNRYTGEAVLPSLGGWDHLIPRSLEQEGDQRAVKALPQRVRYLGHRYRLLGREDSNRPMVPHEVKVIELTPDVLVGVPHNTRQKDATRRYDDSDYELVRLTREDYQEMIQAGMNCLRVDAEQLPWIIDENVYYWGLGGSDLPFPESLYRSQFLGPALFLDEPAVCTRDHVIRPRLREDAAFRKALTPQTAFELFQEYFDQESLGGAPWRLIRGLEARADVDLGDMKFPQENLYSWETMVSSAAYQLAQDPRVPAAMVFEPPGRVGTLRTLPELNMTYGCQIPVDDPSNLTGIILGFLRGAARLTDKTWGMSIYGSVDRTDAFSYLTRAYDLGATHFFFWDTHRLACVPYPECLALARALKAHLENRPQRNLESLKRAADIAILLPPGYNLGHVHLGKGNLWGLGELNLERVNRRGVKYRVVMNNFFTEIERCIRLGVAFDPLWDLPGLEPSGYREVIRVREDGKVEVRSNGEHLVMDRARVPTRPPGASPELSIALSADQGEAPLKVTARARVVETAAPVYYTVGTDPSGVYRNAMVAWELYGPGEEDYRNLGSPGPRPRVSRKGTDFEVRIDFTLDRPGNYRLRASTVDTAGRTRTIWKSLAIGE